MRAENGQEDQDGSVTSKLQETAWKSQPALSLHRSQHTTVLWGLNGGPEAGPGMPDPKGPSLSYMQAQWTFFSIQRRGSQLTNSPRRTLPLLDLPCQYLDSAGMGWF